MTCISNGRAMPFLHGFRRIIYEYQPLVDAIMRVIGIGEDQDDRLLLRHIIYIQGVVRNEELGWKAATFVSRVRSPEEESGVCTSLVELLERESHSEVFLEGISYALLKVAERGLLYAAETLLRYGADLNFEGKLCVCCLLNTHFYTHSTT